MHNIYSTGTYLVEFLPTYMYTVHTYFAGGTQLFLVFHHVAFVVRALVSLANRVDGFVWALLLGRYDGQKLNEKVRWVVVLRAADAEPIRNYGLDLIYCVQRSGKLMTILKQSELELSRHENVVLTL